MGSRASGASANGGGGGESATNECQDERTTASASSNCRPTRLAAEREAPSEPEGPEQNPAAVSRFSRTPGGRRPTRSKHLRRRQQPAPLLLGCRLAGDELAPTTTSNCAVCTGSNVAGAAGGGHEGAASCCCLLAAREQTLNNIVLVGSARPTPTTARLIPTNPNEQKHQEQEQQCAAIRGPNSTGSSTVARNEDQAVGRRHNRHRQQQQRLSLSSVVGQTANQHQECSPAVAAGGESYPAGALPVATLLATQLSPLAFMDASSKQASELFQCVNSSACCASGCPDEQCLGLPASQEQPPVTTTSNTTTNIATTTSTAATAGNACCPVASSVGVGGPYSCSRSPALPTAERQVRARQVGGGPGYLRQRARIDPPLLQQQPVMVAAGATCTCCTVPVVVQASLIASPATAAAAAAAATALMAAGSAGVMAAATGGSAATNSMSLQVSSCSQQQPVGQDESKLGAGESPESKQQEHEALTSKQQATNSVDASNSLTKQQLQLHQSLNSHSKPQHSQQCYFVSATRSELLDEKQQLNDSQPYETTATPTIESTDTARPLCEGNSKRPSAINDHGEADKSGRRIFTVAADSAGKGSGARVASRQRRGSSEAGAKSRGSGLAKHSSSGKQAQLATRDKAQMGGGSGPDANKTSNNQELDHFQQHHKDPQGNAHWDWKGISSRYGKMPRQSKGQFWWRMRQSCLCQLFSSGLEALFPILGSFKSYSLPGDFITDIVAGFTIAVLHIPQGMAYGLLAGVEPIYGLYVSFVPVLIMALMSKSRHVSYGTFAVISMLLVNATESVKELLKQQLVTSGQLDVPAPAKVLAEPLTSSSSSSPLAATSQQQQEQVAGSAIMAGNELGGLVLTNNHQQPPSTDSIQRQQLLLRSLLTPSVAGEAGQTEAVEQAIGLLGLSLNSSLIGNGRQPAQPLVGAGSPLEASSTAGLWLSAVAPTEGASVSSLAASSSSSIEFMMPTNIEILTCICILVGLIQMCMALMRLGILSLMFSDQLVSSFTTASAIHVVTSQIGGLFDMNLPPVAEGTFRVCRVWWVFANKLTEGFNQYTGLLSLTSVLFLLSVKEILEPILRRRFKSLTCLPSELILMSSLIFSSWYFEFNEIYDIRIIGNVPTGLPAPQIPRLELAPLVIEDALTVALVSFAMNLSLAQVYAKRYRYTMDPNQELFALGTANFVSSFFSCFPCASSLSRSAVQSNLNVRSQLCSLFSCAIVVAIICYFAPILHDLPRSTLCCIIIVALKGILVQVKDLYENWRLSKLDAFVWIATFLSVLAFGVTYGLALGIVASLFMIFFRLLTPNHSILGQLPGTEIYVDSNAFIDCNEIEQVKIFRFNSALCYLNRTMFKSRVEKSLPSIYKQQGFNLFCSTTTPTTDSKETHNGLSYSNDTNNIKVKFLVIDCSALAYCDYSGAATLVEIVEELEENGLHVYLAACPMKLINMIEKMQKTRVLEHNVYPSITDAVNHAKYLRCKTIMLQQHQAASFGVSFGLPTAAATTPTTVVGESTANDGKGGGGFLHIDGFN